MTTTPSAIAEVIERCTVAQVAYDLAAEAGDDVNSSLRSEEEDDAVNELVMMPCTSDAELLEKLRFLLARETKLWGSPFDSSAEFCSIAQAVATYLEAA